MKCPNCNNNIPYKKLLKTQADGGNSAEESMLCPGCSEPVYFRFNQYVLFFSTFIALLGLSKIGSLQMQYHFALASYIFLSVVCIAFVGVRLTSKPSTLEQIKHSKIHQLNFAFYLFLITMSGYLVTAVYLNIAPDQKSLVEINGTVKSLNIQNGMFNYIELNNDPYNLKYLIQDRFESKAAYLPKNSRIKLYVEKNPSITGDSYRVWEIKSDNNEILLPYYDLKVTRGFAGSLEYTPIFKLLGIALLGYFVTLRFKKNADKRISESDKETVSGDSATQYKTGEVSNSIKVKRPYRVKAGLTIVTALVIAIYFLYHHISDDEAVKIASTFLTKAGIPYSSQPHIENLKKPEMPFFFNVLDFVLGNIVFNHNNGKKVIVGEELKEDHYLSINDSKEVGYYSNRKIEKEVYKKYNISPDNRKPRNWPTLLTESKAKELAVYYANKIGLPKDVEFSQMYLNLQYNGTWDATWIRKLNGYPYEGDSCHVSIMAIDGELHSYNKRFSGKPCPTVVKVTKEEAIEKGWEKVTSIFNSEKSKKVKNEYDVTSSELMIVQPNVFLGRVIPNVFWKSKNSRLAWVIRYRLKAEPTVNGYESKLYQFGHHGDFKIYVDAANKRILGGETEPCM